MGRLRAAKKDSLKNKAKRCLKCGTTKRLTIDHVIPKSKGGTSHRKNLQVLCRQCNEEKGDQIIDYRPSVTRA